jgi:hypothetical protein
MFRLGESYTRKQISEQVGGNPMSYLPDVDGRVVAACLKPDINPAAPSVIVVGRGSAREQAADLLVRQGTPVPVFLRRRERQWEYVGDFRVKRSSRSTTEIAKYARHSSHPDIVMVIHMAPAPVTIQSHDRRRAVRNELLNVAKPGISTPPTPERYLARLCWNTKNWTRPTGEAALIEQGTYSARIGFGHEEWLFNFDRILDGWTYSFLQPVGRSLTRVQGRTLDVNLYTISPERNWWYVGQLHRCEVLTEEMADHARKEFKRRGWFKEMADQVHQVGGNATGLQGREATSIFNIRFHQADAERYPSMVPVGKGDAIRKLRRYALVPVRGDIIEIERQWASRVAATQRRPTGKRSRSGQPATTFDLLQNQLQNEIFDLLVARDGRSAVTMEEEFVDITLRRPGSLVLIEVKSDKRARYAVREALGQLLEYAFVCGEKGDSVDEMIVAGPGKLKSRERRYLEHLKAQLGLPVRYVCFNLGDKEVQI